MTHPLEFVAIDPGLAKVGGSGWAKFGAGRLVACGVVRNHKTWLTVPQRVRGQFTEFAYIAGVVQTVCESMVQRYGPMAAKVPPQDLIDLNLLAGHLGDCWVTPTVWKGGVKQSIEQARTLHALTPEERVIFDAAIAATTKGTQKEIYSAVGIGLSVAKRAHRKCGWPL